jgi:galacturonosyltransferase 12/13/14/15
LQRLVRDLYSILDEISSEEVPTDVKLPESFNEFVWDLKNNNNDLRSFAFKLKAMVSLASMLPSLLLLNLGCPFQPHYVRIMPILVNSVLVVS